MGWIKFVGNSTRGVFSVFSYYRALQPPILVFFHGNCCGNHKFLQRLVSLFGKRLWGQFQPLII